MSFKKSMKRLTYFEKINLAFPWPSFCGELKTESLGLEQLLGDGGRHLSDLRLRPDR